MTDLKNQRRMASDLLKCGANRIWLDQDRSDKIAGATTRMDVHRLIEKGFIRKKSITGTSRFRANKLRAQRDKGRRGGQGTRKGKKYSVVSRKRRWIKKIRGLRSELRDLKKEEKISKTEYRKLYLQAKGGMFKSASHLRSHLGIEGKRQVQK